MNQQTTTKVTYLGELRTEAIHTQSMTRIITDAPTDNHGKGEAFSPTDLVATALCSCMMTLMGIKADANGWDLGEIKAEVYKVMESSPRRIAKVKINFELNSNLDEAEKKVIEKTALNCPVAKSLSSDLEQEIHFHWL